MLQVIVDCAHGIRVAYPQYPIPKQELLNNRNQARNNKLYYYFRR